VSVYPRDDGTCPSALEQDMVAKYIPKHMCSCNGTSRCSATYSWLCTHREHSVRDIHTTPATTNVAAWMTALTAVGPSIASGNQECKPKSTLLILTMAKHIMSMIPTAILCCVLLAMIHAHATTSISASAIHPSHAAV
jgi:hypothetical protein